MCTASIFDQKLQLIQGMFLQLIDQLIISKTVLLYCEKKTKRVANLINLNATITYLLTSEQLAVAATQKCTLNAKYPR